jgi:hypothetical protein
MLIVAWLEAELEHGQSPNYFCPMEPRHIGYCRKALVIVKTMLTLF